MDAMFSVVIGRFQPPHNAHFELFEEALKRSKKLIILIGSTEIPRSIKNPFTFEERSTMIHQVLWDRGYKSNQFSILSVPDAFYSDAMWTANVQAQVMSITKGNQDVLLVGYFKDRSSYYLRMFPQWKFHSVDELENGLSSSQIRDAWFTGGEVKDTTVSYFLNNFRLTPAYGELAEEYRYIQEYKQSWENTPYPVIFVTVDAVALCAGHVLLVRRNESPGKGNWALPGGFVNQNETLLDACIRELYEETNLMTLPNIIRDRVSAVKVFDYPDRSLRGRVITHAHLFNFGIGVPPEVSGGSDASHAEWKPLHWIFANSDKVHEDHLSIITYFVTNNT